jgi:hypothetical protein
MTITAKAREGPKKRLTALIIRTLWIETATPEGRRFLAMPGGEALRMAQLCNI